MIEFGCACGKMVCFPESRINQSLHCSACHREIHLACAEQLPDGAGAGDFDASLTVRQGPQRQRQTICLGGVADILFGKHAASTIALAGEFVSNSHCKLVRVDFGPSRWKLVDAGGANGTFVNGQRITEHELAPGDIIDIGEYEMVFAICAVPAVPTPPAPPVQTTASGPVCPSCGKTLAAKSKFCIDCGINITTGRALVLSREFDENDFAVRSDTWIRLISWVVPFGLFPVASEAMGTRKPVVTWVIAAITIITSIAFFIATAGESDPSPNTLNLMLWTGTPGAASGNDLSEIVDEVRKQNASEPDHQRLSERQIHDLARRLAEENSTMPEGVGFRWYQPLTCAFLHGGIMHLAGNLLFLIVFGTRVNELTGNLRFAIIYPALAFASGWAYMLFDGSGPPHPMLGASGAIMGLAGMYFIFFPIQRVYTAIWLRLRFWCAYKVFPMRGFWLLLLWIGFNDVLMMFFGSMDGVAHWAHVGGFLAGGAIALGLMIGRLTNAGGSDILSVILGRRAWAILGKPSTRSAPKALTSPAAAKATSMNYPGA